MRLTLCAFVTSVTFVTSAFAQSGSYLVRLGNDTLAVEKFTRTATRLEGDVATRLPRTSLRHYVAEFDATGRIRSIVGTMLPPANPAGAPVMVQRMNFTADSANFEIRRGDSVLASRRFALGHNAPALMGPYALWETVIAQALRARTDSTPFDGYVIGQNGTIGGLSVWRIGRDSVAMSTPWDVYHAKVDRNGSILGSKPLFGTTQFAITRVSDVDVRGSAARWAANPLPAVPNSGGANGLSRRDTVQATVGGAQLMVDYGRPSKRGRNIFPDVVRYDSIWRTGANAATQFRTDRALDFGGVVLPAGLYTLWTLPSAGGWKLIINSETGQWGTDHHAERDLFQLPMTMSRPPQPVEMFTISVVPSAQGGVLRFEWDTTRAEIPFTVR